MPSSQQNGFISSILTNFNSNGDGKWDNMHGLAQTHGADKMHLFISCNPGGGTVGLAYVGPGATAGVTALRFGSDVYHHEVGHNLGMGHDAEQGCSAPNCGWCWNDSEDPGLCYSSVQTYGCGTYASQNNRYCTAYPAYSNKLKSVHGNVMGSNSADNAGLLNSESWLRRNTQQKKWVYPGGTIYSVTPGIGFGAGCTSVTIRGWNLGGALTPPPPPPRGGPEWKSSKFRFTFSSGSGWGFWLAGVKFLFDREAVSISDCTATSPETSVSGTQPQNMLNNDLSSEWRVGNHVASLTLTITCPTPRTIEQYIWATGSHTLTIPRQWKLEGLADQVVGEPAPEWVTLGEQTTDYSGTITKNEWLQTTSPLDYWALDVWGANTAAPAPNPPPPGPAVYTKVTLDGVAAHKVVSASNTEIVVLAGPMSGVSTKRAHGTVSVEVGSGWTTSLDEAFAYYPSTTSMMEDFDENKGSDHSQGWAFSDMFGSSHSTATMPAYFRTGRDGSQLPGAHDNGVGATNSFGRVEMPQNVVSDMAELRLGAGYGLNADPSCDLEIKKISFKYRNDDLQEGKKMLLQYLEKGKSDAQSNWKTAINLNFDCSQAGVASVAPGNPINNQFWVTYCTDRNKMLSIRRRRGVHANDNWVSSGDWPGNMTVNVQAVRIQLHSGAPDCSSGCDRNTRRRASFMAIDDANIEYKATCPNSFQCGSAFSNANSDGVIMKSCSGLCSGGIIAIAIVMAFVALGSILYGLGELNTYVAEGYRNDQIVGTLGTKAAAGSAYLQNAISDGFASFEDADGTELGVVPNQKEGQAAPHSTSKDGDSGSPAKISDAHHTVKDSSWSHQSWSNEADGDAI